jgi:hypothetical protein
MNEIEPCPTCGGVFKHRIDCPWWTPDENDTDNCYPKPSVDAPQSGQVTALGGRDSGFGSRDQRSEGKTALPLSNKRPGDSLGRSL